MNTIQSLRTEVKDLIRTNDLKRAIETLRNSLDLEEAPSLDKHLIGLTRRYNSTMDERMAQTASRPELEIALNQLTDSLYEFMNEITEEHLCAPHLEAETYKMIGHPLLIVGGTPAQAQETKELLSYLNFTNLTGVTADKITSLTSFDPFDLVIFDNFDLAIKPETPAEALRIEARTSAMQSVVDRSKVFLIHYGNYLNWVNEHRDRVNAANSKFTLYARIYEVLSFIQTYRI